MDGTDVLDAMRRGALLDRVNAQGNNAVDELGAMTEDLNIQQEDLSAKLDKQTDLLSSLKDREAEMRASLAAAEQAEQQLKARAERERRGRRSCRADWGRGPCRGGEQREGQWWLAQLARSVVIGGGFQCPVPGSSFGDSFGAPRSGGRRHQGVDMMAGYGTPIYAVVSGSVSHSTSGLGGNQIWLVGSDGNKYFYANLREYVGSVGAVSAGDQIGPCGRHGQRQGDPAPPLRDPSGRRRRGGTRTRRCGLPASLARTDR